MNKKIFEMVYKTNLFILNLFFIFLHFLFSLTFPLYVIFLIFSLKLSGIKHSLRKGLFFYQTWEMKHSSSSFACVGEKAKMVYYTKQKFINICSHYPIGEK